MTELMYKLDMEKDDQIILLPLFVYIRVFHGFNIFTESGQGIDPPGA